MSSPARLFAGLLASACLTACPGGTITTADLALPDRDLGGRDQSLPPTDGPAVPPDGGPDGGDDFCSGAAPRILYRGQRLDPAIATSSRLVLNCCDGLLARFHLEAQGGQQAGVVVERLGGLFAATDFRIEHKPADIEVTLLQQLQPVTSTLSGTVRLTGPGGGAIDGQHPIELTLCADVSAPGHAFNGARLYLPKFPVMSFTDARRFTITLLQDRNITASQALRAPLESLALEPDPLVDLYQIGWYGRADHRVTWDNLGSSTLLRNRVGQVGTSGVPFVVSVDGKRVYLGAFFRLLSSESFAAPVIVMEQVTDAGFTIESGYPVRPLNPDPRAAPSILNALTATGKLGP